MERSLFDAELGEKLKEEGMDLAAERRAAALEVARSLAFQIARHRVDITADDVYRVMPPHLAEALGPAAGRIFTGRMWRFTGRWVKSQRASNRSRFIRVWRLR